ncbi:MAG: threonine--tRNA ligase [Bacteroidia bacterium]|nr:threonine--tRNA ligase [Bacteroidia bacterium]
MNIKITLPDASIREVPQGTSALDVAKGISEGLARVVISAKINGEVWDLNRPITEDSKLSLLKFDDLDGKKTFWHSSSHLLAEALETLYPGVKLGIGPAIDNGFYYDVDFGDHQFSSNDFEKVEQKMKELANQSNTFERKEISKSEAITYFTEKNDPYKLELIDGLEDGQITFYTQGNFTDLCRGPHIQNSSSIKAIKLLNVAAAYWRGDEKNKSLTRIYGVSFPKTGMLKEHMNLLEEAKKRDHRKLGKELELFMFSEKVGAGLPLWLPKGTAIRERLENFMRQAQIERGYQQVVTPHIGRKELYMTSGHYEKYGEDSFQPIKTPSEDEEFLLKPMNCPHHCEVFKFKPKSYKELPLRIAEFGTVYRYEQSGELNGLTRVRGFTQDDAHIFCTPDQLKGEFVDVIDLVMHVFGKLGFKDFNAQISLRDPENKQKYIGSDENWDKAERAIIEATGDRDMKTITEYGEAAFYGPKLDFMVKDALGRSWQLGTIQVDYNLPERFDLDYIGSDNEKHRPVMIHRAPFGSMERFIGILIEHTAGNFPLWLSPEQVAILPISEKYHDYSDKVLKFLNKNDIRGLIDQRAEKIGRKIRDAWASKIPVMIIIGEKESDNQEVSVRLQGEGDVGKFKLDEFVDYFNSLLNKD